MSSSWKSRYSQDEEDEDEDNFMNDLQETQWNNRDSILFAIDCSPDMFKVEGEDDEAPFYTAIKCAMSVLLNKIISSETDLVGIFFYGTAKSKNSHGFENIFVLQDLETPDVQKIQQLQSIDDRTTSFEQEFGSSGGQYKLGEVFWTASSIFSAGAQRVGTKRLFLFTNEDQPHRSEPGLQNASRVKAKDLGEYGVKIELFDIDKPDEKFNRSYFYKEILKDGMDGEEDEDEADAEDTSTKLSELFVRVQRKEVKKRSLFSIPFKLAPGLEFGVRGYNMVMSQKKGTHRNVYTRGDVVRETVTVTSWICADTTQFLTPADLKFYWEFGGIKVLFTKEEVAAMKTFGPPSLALIGFKPSSVLKMNHNINHAVFLYPDEKNYEGSTRAFASLLTAMAEMDKVAICSFTQRTNYSTRLVALVPQLEIVNESGQAQPPGLQIVPLPWADDIRPLPIQTEYRPPDELIEAAKKVIDRLKMKKGFKPDNYENPALQKHYKVLQAIALNQTDYDIDDKTLPKTAQMSARAGAHIQHFLDVLETVELLETQSASVPASKRASQSQGDGAGPAKKARAQPANANDIVEDIKAKYDNNQLNKATVASLKEFLAAKQLKPNSTKKADLISQVEAYFA